MKKKTHGGKRKGSGRPLKDPKLIIKTTTIRVPESLVGKIREVVRLNSMLSHNGNDTNSG